MRYAETLRSRVTVLVPTVALVFVAIVVAGLLIRQAALVRNFAEQGVRAASEASRFITAQQESRSVAVRAGRSAAEFNQAIDGAITKLEGFARDAPDARLAVEQETAVQLLRATEGMFRTDLLAAAGSVSVRGNREYASQIGTYHANLEAAGGKLSAHGTELYTDLIGSESWSRVTAVEYALVTGGSPPIADADWRAAARDVGDRLSALYVQQSTYATQLAVDSGRRTLTGALAAGAAILILAGLVFCLATQLTGRMRGPVLRAPAAPLSLRTVRSSTVAPPDNRTMQAVLEGLRQR
ncbi:nitrate- and nitrite sensing domain-containing protein [Amycolatopsis sp. NPDC059657]|uniref:nitrate- and nitrite sensing domain-containing protein n=1 Tax=Amycolatopsis sp. NPDC059657 TaxID=3346899 RepID=UPI00366C86C4